jgi:hypothetical protein
MLDGQDTPAKSRNPLFMLGMGHGWLPTSQPCGSQVSTFFNILPLHVRTSHHNVKLTSRRILARCSQASIIPYSADSRFAICQGKAFVSSAESTTSTRTRNIVSCNTRSTGSRSRPRNHSHAHADAPLHCLVLVLKGGPPVKSGKAFRVEAQWGRRGHLTTEKAHHQTCKNG